MKEKPDIIYLTAASRSTTTFFSQKQQSYRLAAGKISLKVVEISRPFHQKELACLYQAIQRQGIPALALPLSAVAAYPPQRVGWFAADGRLLSLALAAEAWHNRYPSADDIVPAVDISLSEGRLLARMAPHFLRRFCLWGGTAEYTAQTARQIYQESGLVVEAGRGEVLLRPAGTALRPQWQPTPADFILPLPNIATATRVCNAALAEAALFCALRQPPKDPYLLLQALRRQAYRCKYYGQYEPDK